MSLRPLLLPLIALSLLLGSCSHSKPPHADNAIYYWRTVFTLNDNERRFLADHDINKLYIRYFDVDYSFDDGAIPNATIKFTDSVPEGIQVVPVVYITTSAMDNMTPIDDYASKILRRVAAISRHNGIDFNEIQLDCDWNRRCRDNFFALCSAMKQQMDSTMALSSTIRLHQLIQTPPPVDKGVLMVYNTGNLTKYTTENSIFSKNDIDPYLADSRLTDYDLPLDIAYPAYGWSVIFRECYDGHYEFARLAHNTDLSTLHNIKRVGKNLYEVTEDTYLDPESDCWENRLWEGWRIKVERPDVDEILRVKSMIESRMEGRPHNIILYHLNESQLSNFSDNEIDKIYSCD